MTTQGRPPSEPTQSRPSGASTSTPGMTDKVQDAASRAVGSVQETTKPVVDKATGTAQQVAEQATEQVTSRLDMAVDYAAETLTGVAQAVRQTGQHLREEGSQPTLGRYADTGAQQVERLGGYLRQHDATEILSEVETYARRNPMTFAGGAFALGMLAARFFRASGQRSQTSSMRSGASYGSSYRPTPPPAPRPVAPPPAPRPNFNASNPPSYSSGAPAARNIPASPDWAPPSPSSGSGTTGRDAERLTPTPGSQSGTGSTPSGAAPSTGGTTPPAVTPNTGPGSATPNRTPGTSGSTSSGSERPGSGSQRQV